MNLYHQGWNRDRLEVEGGKLLEGLAKDATISCRHPARWDRLPIRLAMEVVAKEMDSMLVAAMKIGFAISKQVAIGKRAVGLKPDVEMD